MDHYQYFDLALNDSGTSRDPISYTHCHMVQLCSCVGAMARKSTLLNKDNSGDPSGTRTWNSEKDWQSKLFWQAPIDKVRNGQQGIRRRARSPCARIARQDIDITVISWRPQVAWSNDRSLTSRIAQVGARHASGECQSRIGL